MISPRFIAFSSDQARRISATIAAVAPSRAGVPPDSAGKMSPPLIPRIG